MSLPVLSYADALSIAAVLLAFVVVAGSLAGYVFVRWVLLTLARLRVDWRVDRDIRRRLKEMSR